MASLKLIITATVLALLCNCSTPYKRDGWLDGWMGGFVTTRVDSNTFIISFRGNYFTSYQQAQNSAMYRAAEVTINAGYDYFLVTNSSAMLPQNNPRSYYQIPTPSPCVKKQDDHGFVMAIKTFQGNVPIGLPNSYDAKEIITQLGPSMY